MKDEGIVNYRFFVKSGLVLVFAAIALVCLGALTGCSEETARPQREVHPEGWGDPASPNFHAEALEARGFRDGLAGCRVCHTSDTAGYQRAPGCFTCHAGYPHPEGWINPLGPDTITLHAKHLQDHNWNVRFCQNCHNADYRRQFTHDGQLTRTCYDCHSGGPEGCTVCHGGVNPGPPPDLKGQSDAEIVTVGAHQRHTQNNRLSISLTCNQCHIYPQAFDAATHIDTATPGQAEVVFGLLASDSGRTNPQWDRHRERCASVYCHGAFANGEQDNEPKWTDGDQAECGSCHKLPPDSPHPGEDNCSNCHRYARSTHINGVVNFR